MYRFTIAILGVATLFLVSFSAYGENCGQYLEQGITYRNWHQGPTLEFTGQITINGTYKCPEGTCFKAEMSFDNHNDNVDKATGFWSGSHFELIRSAGDLNQVWKGECRANSVRGRWYFRENENDNGRFSITY